VAGLTIDLPDEATCGNAGSNISEGGAEGATWRNFVIHRSTGQQHMSLMNGVQLIECCHDE